MPCNKTAGQGNHRENSNNEANCPVGPAQIVPDMRRQGRQNAAETQESQKSGGDQPPEARAQLNVTP
jgi:hypothetical protein